MPEGAAAATAATVVGQERQEKGWKGRVASQFCIRRAKRGGVGVPRCYGWHVKDGHVTHWSTSPCRATVASLPHQEPWRNSVIQLRHMTWRGQTD